MKHIPSRRADFTEQGKKLVLRELLHLPLRRTSLLQEMPEDLRVGANAVIGPLRGVGLAGRLPLYTDASITSLCAAESMMSINARHERSSAS